MDINPVGLPAFNASEASEAVPNPIPQTTTKSDERILTTFLELPNPVLIGIVRYGEASVRSKPGSIPSTIPLADAAPLEASFITPVFLPPVNRIRFCSAIALPISKAASRLCLFSGFAGPITPITGFLKEIGFCEFNSIIISVYTNIKEQRNEKSPGRFLIQKIRNMARKYLYNIDNKINKIDLGNFERVLFILHDQLNLSAWPEKYLDGNTLLLFMEAEEKGREIPHHKQKLVYAISSMRHFAVQCHEHDLPVFYHFTKGHFDDGIEEIMSEFKGKIVYMKPSEWDTRERLQRIKKKYDKRVIEIENCFFLADPGKWKSKIGSGFRMEYFYREMRKQTCYLMDGRRPEGGKWNYDKKNRKPLPEDTVFPEVPPFSPDEITREVMEMIREKYPGSFGKLGYFNYGVTGEQALTLLNDFINRRLACFGPYEDALHSGNHMLFHSQLSIYMNNGLLLPDEVCEKAIQAYRERKDIPLHSIEGFIRQVIGWREFIRIYYEAMMPDVRNANHFGFSEKLPEMYWTGETDMKCMSEALTPVINDGYAHHIQRLMVLSNLSNLTLTDPAELNRWFWIAFVDAYEWVELPNVLGMSTFADGGVLASKPYVSSGNYINKMSNYCKSCKYNVTKKNGPNACPFNYLYWNFVKNHRNTFEDNGRSNFILANFDKKGESEKKEISNSSEKYLSTLKR